MSERISVLEGDARSGRLCELLRRDGREARLFGADQAAAAAEWGHIVVLPVKGVPSESLNGLLTEDQILVSGEDFLCREDFAVLNAIATAEGALEIALREMPRTLHGAEALCMGYGRIGKVLCRLLCSLGARVSAAARRTEHFAWMESCGVQPMHIHRIEGALGGFDCVFNTVPHLVLPYARLRELPRECVVVDLASNPGGVDFKAAGQLGVNVHWALSLPGKCAPESAAAYLRDTLYRILEERG